LDRYIPPDVQRYVARLERRVKALERMEAPGERYVGMKAMQIVDQADRKGAYKSVFEKYIRRGELPLSESERYTLYSRRTIDTNQPGTVDARIKALNITNAGSVGFAVPPDWLTELNKNISVNAAMFAEARKQTTSSDTIVMPDLVTTDARRAYPGRVNWVGESPANQAASQITDMTLAQINLPISVALVSTTVTYSALEDVISDLGAIISEQFAEALWVEYETLIWNGDGQGKLRGIVNDARVTGAQSTGVSSVGGYINSGAAASINSGDPLLEMRMHLPPQYRRRAKWYANSNTINAIRKLKDGQGRYLWGDDGGLNNGEPTTLLGSPIVYNDFASDIAAGSFPLIFADMYSLYMVGQRVEFSIRRFDDSQFAVQDQVLYIGRARVGGMVVKPYAAKVLRIAVS
jgi:HK97 family phage major capsid protein